MDAAPEVSIVVVAYQARDDVLACLRSVEAHADLSYEVVVVDDGSDDRTADVVRERHPSVTVLAKAKNEGLVAGRNSALEVVNGKRVLMLDADTQLTPNALSEMANALDSSERTGLVGPRLVNPDGSLQLSCRRMSPLLIPFMRRGPYARVNPDPAPHRWHLMKDFDHATERPVVWVSGAAQMWKTEVRDRIGPYDPKISSYGGEDKDWCLRIWDAGLEVRYVPSATVIHAWQHVIRSKPWGRSTWRALRDWYYVLWKHRKLRRDPRLRDANA